MTEIREPHLVWDVQAKLGEGPVWVWNALWFTDIKSHRIHRFDPATGDKRSWDAPEQVGFVLPADDGGFIAGLQSGLHHFDADTGSFELILAVEPDLPDNRLNDGTVDCQGRLWFGTMDNGEGTKTGSYYCFHQGKLTHSGLSGIAITNGPAVSTDGRLYWVDTIERGVFVCEVADDGRLGPSRPFTMLESGCGNPDGPSVDSDGNLWIGLYSGWAARCYSPAGELLREVRFPVQNITKVAFGGDDMRTAFATTARHLLSPGQLEAQPQAGGLFAFEVDMPGVPCPMVRL